MNEINKLDKEYKKPLQTYFSETEWNMIEELKKETGAITYASVIRASLLKYYKIRILDKQIKETKQ